MTNNSQIISYRSSEPFPCTQCGKCCKNVHLSDLTSWLDRGDGVCRNLDTVTNLCKIYQTRPDICRIEKQYFIHYAEDYTWEEFKKLNLEVCEILPG
ncbi:YkgJ family cysteine cluster protein [Marinobacter sp. VGCF2001]|uniref:YkgJ family cysteine cluster protein n=1 Tax=Marinobacter sp. VGCF2001 TaxID=3417189 RepID=UPI003CE6DD5F